MSGSGSFFSEVEDTRVIFERGRVGGHVKAIRITDVTGGIATHREAFEVRLHELLPAFRIDFPNCTRGCFSHNVQVRIRPQDGDMDRWTVASVLEALEAGGIVSKKVAQRMDLNWTLQVGRRQNQCGLG